MKQKFKNTMAFCLLILYSFSISISIPDYIVTTNLDGDLQQQVAVNVSDSKTPILSVFPDLEPLVNISGDNTLSFYSENFKTAILLSKHAETYTLTKDKQYINTSRNIYPSLDKDTLLYPFHTFL